MGTQAGSVPAGTSGEEVIGVRKGHAGIAVLNRPKALNSLTRSMVTLLRGLYEEWEQDPSVGFVLIKSDSRAFCAGGDVRTCHNLGKERKWHDAAVFFREEYELDYLVATLKKPHVALVNGVVMGGGNGISMLGSFRVVTEKVLFAMPETLIGLHPDVGASHFLARLPGHMGEYLALTGTRLQAPDMLATGLATHGVPSSRVGELEERLCALAAPDASSIDAAIKEFEDRTSLGEPTVVPKQQIIDKYFQHSTVESILAALEEGAAAEGSEDGPWCTETLATLRKMSPTSLKVSLRSVREGRTQTLLECLIKETRLSFRCVEQTTSHDFFEGVRALLVDKDNSPKFSPATLGEVTDEMIDKHFAPLANKEDELHVPEGR